MVSLFSSSKGTATQNDDRQPGPSRVSQPLENSPIAASAPSTSTTNAPAMQTASTTKLPLYAAMEDSALTVLTRTAAFTAGGGLLGSAVGIMRAEANVPPILLAVRGARSTFLFAGPFYAVREYILNPLWATYLPSAEGRTRSPHFKDLGTSPLAGGIVGLVTALITRRGAQVAQATALYAAICFSGQVVGNELNVLRLRQIAKGEENERIQEKNGGADSVRDGPLIRGFAFKERETDAFPKEKADNETFFGKFFSSIPRVAKISDEEYISKLEERKRELEEELKEVEREA